MFNFNVAVTGGIGSGKSTLLKQMRELLEHPANFYSFDEIVNQIYETDVVFNDWLEGEFGTTDKKEISDHAFKSEVLLLRLSDRISTLVGIKIGKILASPGLNIVEVPLLFKMGIHAQFDHVVELIADEDERIKRVMRRMRDGDPWSVEKIQRVIKLQEIPNKDKMIRQCKSYSLIDNTNLDFSAADYKTRLAFIMQNVARHHKIRMIENDEASNSKRSI